ncbi:hypothetical protein [Clostridium luticellarii]|jgi:hypothetical protein|uniref:hypothetical protein n=1 Tax=Clostridium luticellarii TaxID=1691940 RepID=UPI0023532B67|nr:hypothetical protein [Clostridium luticellarii]MCI1945588.1 hypothetical protein [Clostridium luticellarii]
MYKELLKIVDENWEEIVEGGNELVRDAFEEKYPEGTKLALIIDGDENVDIQLLEDVNRNIEFVILEVAVPEFIEDEEERIRQMEYDQEHGATQELAKFHEKLADKASDEDPADA